MAQFFINDQPAPFIQSATFETSMGRIHAVSDAAMDRIARGAEILAEAKMRESLADPETWRKLRRLYPSPTVLEGGGKL